MPEINAVTAERVFDGRVWLADHTVMWEAGTVVWLGATEMADLADAQVIHTGGFVVPGLIDAHVHLSLDGTVELLSTVAEEPVDRTQERADANAAAFLKAGITTVRDMASREAVAIDAAGRQRRGLLSGAFIVPAGRGITPPGGHGWMMSVVTEGAGAVAEAVAAEIERGAEVIKLFPTGGVLGTGRHGDVVTMTVEEVAAAVAVAHDAGVPVGAHVVGSEGIDVVLEGGVDTIEHAVGITPAQADRCVAQGVTLVPTLTAVAMMERNADRLPPDVLERTNAVASRHRDGIRTAIDRGVRVIAGTDAGTPFNHPGSLVTELELLAGLGLGPAGALAAASGSAGEALGLAGRGILAASARADLLVLDGDPMTSFDELVRPRLVVQSGTVVG